ncbi:arylsulfatase [Xylariomycetidae sp. FL0641]|nr:arylsulfatase [Xylariomycetidae sp. FL0641]
MPLLKKYVTDEGMTFPKHYCTVSLCCPSRVNMWAGKAAHNTNVTDLSPPYGGYPKFVEGGFNTNYLPIWMQDAGYNTYHVGKLFNSLSVDNYNKPWPGGWTGSDYLLDPYTYEYYNATFQRNRDPPKSYEGQYSTDVVAEKAAGFLRDALADTKPFFLTVSPTSPHSTVTNGTQSPPQPARRHAGLFADAVVPRHGNFNPEAASGVSWVAGLPRQNQTNVDYNDAWYRDRLRTLQATDEMVAALVAQLAAAGALARTYVVYSTDNGYAIGQHRRQPGKQCAFEEDINIPLIVRGPGVPRGATSDLVTSHTDIAPTFLAIAGVEAAQREQYELDGAVIPLDAATTPTAEDDDDPDDPDTTASREHVNVEMWGIIVSEGIYGYVLYNNHTYKALRVVGDGYSLLYTVWCTGQHELYDMARDPWQMANLVAPNNNNNNASSPRAPYDLGGGVSTSVRNLRHRLDALVLVLKTCKAATCRRPWGALHPAGDVRSLRDAAAPRYDGFYAELPRVRWDHCANGYIKELESPFWDGDLAFAGAMHHEVWTGARLAGEDEF